MAGYHALAYMRTSRPKTDIIYGLEETFPIGGSKVIRESANDVATVVAVGVTVYEALKAHDQLKAQGIDIRVIDAYSVQPIDAATLMASGKATRGVIITVEDHYAGDRRRRVSSPAVRGHALRRELPGGQPAELLDRYGISAKHIVDASGSLPEAVVSRTATGVALATLAFTLVVHAAQMSERQAPAPRGAREPAWAPDGRRLAFSYLDRIWLSAPGGRGGRALRPQTTDIERDPAWSPDGRSIIFAADAGQGFDLVVLPASGGDWR
jgi:hypothetical protein